MRIVVEKFIKPLGIWVLLVFAGLITRLKYTDKRSRFVDRIVVLADRLKDK